MSTLMHVDYRPHETGPPSRGERIRALLALLGTLGEIDDRTMITENIAMIDVLTSMRIDELIALLIEAKFAQTGYLEVRVKISNTQDEIHAKRDEERVAAE